MSKALERQAAKIAKEYTGKIAFPTIGLALSVFCLHIVVLYMFASGSLSPILTILLLGVLTYASYTPVHEYTHGNISGNTKHKWLDTVCGFLMSPIFSIPVHSHKKEHMAHHTHVNSEQDPDVHVKDLMKSFKDSYKVSMRVVKTQNTFVWDNITKTEIAISIGWRVLFVLATGLISVPVLFFGWFLGAFVTTYLFSYLPHQPYKYTSRWKNANIQLFPSKWFDFLMFGQNYHAIHHLFPGVPFYSYRNIFNKIEPTMRKQETPIINMFNRRPV